MIKMITNLIIKLLISLVKLWFINKKNYMKLSRNVTKYYKKPHKITQNLQKIAQRNTKFTFITHKIHLIAPQKIIGPVTTE